MLKHIRYMSGTILLIPLTALLSLFSFLYGEIEEVKMTWNGKACGSNCGPLIEKELKNLKILDEISINSASGTAVLKWNSKTPFSYRLIKTAMQKVGVAIDDIHLKIRGRVKIEGKDIALYSLGDNSRFRIVSLPITEPGKQNEQPNASLLNANPNIKVTLESDAKQNKILLIEGLLYRPWQTSTSVPAVEQIQEENKSDNL